MQTKYRPSDVSLLWFSRQRQLRVRCRVLKVRNIQIKTATRTMISKGKASYFPVRIGAMVS